MAKMAKKYKRITKKELKKDAFADRALELFFYVRGHQAAAFAILAGIIVIIAGSTYFRRTGTVRHNQADYEFRQAVTIYGMGNITEAFTRFQDVSNLYGNTSSGVNSLYWLGNVYYFQGNYPEARTHFEKYVEQGNDPFLLQSALLGIGDTYLQENDTFSALQKYEEFTSRFSTSALAPKALLQVIRCYKLLNQPDKARLTLDKLAQDYPKSHYGLQAERLIINLM
jgi:TolA-binding protein